MRNQRGNFASGGNAIMKTQWNNQRSVGSVGRPAGSYPQLAWPWLAPEDDVKDCSPSS